MEFSLCVLPRRSLGEVFFDEQSVFGSKPIYRGFLLVFLWVQLAGNDNLSSLENPSTDGFSRLDRLMSDAWRLQLFCECQGCEIKSERECSLGCFSLGSMIQSGNGKTYH